MTARQGWTTAISALCGVGVVVAFHYGRQWADSTCADPTDCSADAMLQRNALVAVVVPLAAIVMMTVLRVRRAWLFVPGALVCHGIAMFAIEHADGFCLPLWLDLCLGAATWTAADRLRSLM